MKKLIFIFAILLALVVVAGCNARKNTTIKFNPKIEGVTEETTVVNSEEAAAKKPLSLTSAPNTLPNPDFAVTSPNEEKIETATGYYVIRGTTPWETHKVMVNDYTLGKYLGGQVRWSYIASVAGGTLKKGDNAYVIKALDRDGNEIASKTVTLAYNPMVVTKLPAVGASAWISFIISLLTSLGYFGYRHLKKVAVKNI